MKKTLIALSLAASLVAGSAMADASLNRSLSGTLIDGSETLTAEVPAMRLDTATDILDDCGVSGLTFNNQGDANRAALDLGLVASAVVRDGSGYALSLPQDQERGAVKNPTEKDTKDAVKSLVAYGVVSVVIASGRVEGFLDRLQRGANIVKCVKDTCSVSLGDLTQERN